LDFVTTPGHLTGPGAREAVGLPAGTHPINVVSTLALMDYDDGLGGTYRMRLCATHPGVTVDEVIENTGFELIIPEHVPASDPPSAEELRLLREEIDPECFYI
jgi:glutaconate CoA-transferase subunit B